MYRIVYMLQVLGKVFVDLISYLQELAGFGITEAEIGAHMTAHPNLRTRGKL